MEKDLKKDFTGIDIFKFLFSLAVIAIHVSVHSFTCTTLPDMLHWLIFLCVPFFFITSGFLVARKVDMLQDNVEVRAFFRHRSFQLLRIYCCWLLIYLPITVYLTIRNHSDVWKSVKGYVFSVLFDGQSEYAWPLWFIYSMAIVFFIFSLLKTRKIPFVLILIFISTALIEWCHYSLHCSEIEQIFRLTYRTIGGGIYIVAGMLLYRNPALNKAIPTITCFCVSILLFLYELPFWELFGGIAFVNLSITIQPHPNWIYLMLRNLSMWIYYIHMYPIFFIAVTCKLYDIKINFITMFCMASSCAIILSIILYLISTKCSKARWLAKLIR